jgi:hypothetical protein
VTVRAEAPLGIETETGGGAPGMAGGWTGGIVVGPAGEPLPPHATTVARDRRPSATHRSDMLKYFKTLIYA